jgi:hypothetical protein
MPIQAECASITDELQVISQRRPEGKNTLHLCAAGHRELHVRRVMLGRLGNQRRVRALYFIVKKPANEIDVMGSQIE